MNSLSPIMAASRRRFNPLSLSPALWLDASDAATLYDATSGGSLVAAGGAVARWEDKSGNSRHATQSLSGSRPTRQTGILNGRDVVLFDGLNDFLASVAFGGNETWTRFVVVQSLNDSQGKVIIAHGFNYENPNPGADILSINVKRLETSQNGFTGTSKISQKISLSALMPSTSFVMASQQCNGTHTGNIGRINGETYSVTNTFSNNPGNFTKVNTAYGIGAYSGGTFPCHCNIAEVLHFPTALSESQRKQVETYLSAKWAGGYDFDAAAYFAAIVAAGSSISSANQAAVNAFVVGCKADGIWSAIKASCLLAGADTLAGALVPLVGPAPTNNNFVSGDYNRTTGLLGGTARRLNTNRANNADLQDNCHAAVWVTATGSGTSVGIIGSNANTFIAQRLIYRTSTTCNDVSGSAYTAPASGLIGIARSSSTGYIRRVSNANTPITAASTGTNGANVAVFARDTAGASVWAGRASFYSLGGSLDLALLDARLATYMSSLT